MSNDNSLSRSEYREGIEEQAEIAIEQAENEDELNELVWEGVDSNRWIMYYSYNIDVLNHSEVGPQEWDHLVSDGHSWKEVIQAMAFDAMRNDVWEEVRRQQE